MIIPGPARPTIRLRHLWRTHAPLALFAVTMAFLGVFFALGILVDPRLITGAPAWLKPTKFVLSFALYALTTGWLLGLIGRANRFKRMFVGFVGWSVVVVFTIETAGIVLQTVRGVRSHFNYATPFDDMVISVMAMAIFVLWGIDLLLAVVLLFERFESPALAWGVRLGLIVALIGMMEGTLMVGNVSAQQLERMQRGDPVTIMGAHSVGVEDGGPGLPGLTWSTEGGDLRAGHFVGIHALQVLPLLALFLSRRRRLGARQATRLVWIAGTVYLGLTLLLTWQALRAQPITAPDALTVSVFAAIVGAGIAASLLTIRPWRKTRLLPASASAESL